jgi:putative glutamine amidotransferase
MRPRIAIPVPHSEKPEYNARCLPQYERAIAASGGEPVAIPLESSNEEVAKLIATCSGVVLPGSPADIDPQKFNASKQPETNPADPARDNVDELLLQDAFNMRKPVFGICYGLQSLVVWRTGSLVQHIQSNVDHEARGKKVAHNVRLEAGSELARILEPVRDGVSEVGVNSSHHQAPETAGDGLRVVAQCPEDGVIEAVEGTDPRHFVIGVQWHPERNFDEDRASRLLFSRFVSEAARYRPRA